MIDLTKYPVLSVRQPWAWLIVQGIKDVENRTWRTSYRGPIYIHAGQTIDHTATTVMYNQGITGVKLPQYIDTTLERGGIVGVATLVDIAETSESQWWDKKSLAWNLADARPLPFVQCRGQQGLFWVKEAAK